MKNFILRYVIVALIALAIGFGFLAFQYYWWVPPAPVATTEVYALYQFAWEEHVVSARTSACFMQDGVYVFYALDHPTGWAFFSLKNLKFGLCLNEPVAESPLQF
jgi:hypothetical protein